MRPPSTGLPPPQPLYFGPSEAPLLGWLHSGPASAPSARLGVLLCGPWGDEDLGAYRGLHELAGRLAQAGLAVLRFDLAGEGDSFDSAGDAEADRWPDWLAAMQAAMGLLRVRSGASQIAVLGVRLGALLAAHAALARNDVAALIGVLPPASGRAWLREARLSSASGGASAAASASTPDGAPPRTDGGLVAGGFELNAATVAHIAGIAWPGRQQGGLAQALLLERSELPLPAPALKAWQALAGTLTHSRRSDLGDVLAIAHSARLPAAAQHEITLWLQSVANSVLPLAQHRAAHVPMRAPVASVVAQGLRESVVRIGGLVGVLSRSVERAPADAAGPPEARGIPGVLLLSSGAERRIGPHRLWVPFARERARLGEVVLRLDLAGLGDSAARPGEPETDIYDARCVKELFDAVEWLRREQGVGPITLVGICSGAYHAWRAALSGLPVQAVVPVNPLVFHWRPGMSLDPNDHAFGQIAISAGAVRSARDPRRWLKLVRGRVHVRVVLGALAARVSASIAQRTASLTRALGMRRPRHDLGRELQQVVRRGIALHFVFSDGEPGRTLLAHEAGDRLGRLLRDGRVHLTTVEQADHTFMLRTGRQNFYNRLNALLDAFSRRALSTRRAALPPVIISS